MYRFILWIPFGTWISCTLGPEFAGFLWSTGQPQGWLGKTSINLGVGETSRHSFRSWSKNSDVKSWTGEAFDLWRVRWWDCQGWQCQKLEVSSQIARWVDSFETFLASTVWGAQLPDSITPRNPRDRGCRRGSLEPLGAFGLVRPEDGGGGQGVADGAQNMWMSEVYQLYKSDFKHGYIIKL